MRASRLLSILMLLQSRGRLSAPALAAELEVSERTILRDMDQLSAAGVPVWADRGRDGGFQLREGWSTSLTGLTTDEAHALFLTGVPHAAAELGLSSAAISARLKMLAAVPEASRTSATNANERLHFDPIDWYRAAVPTRQLKAIAECVWQQRIAVIDYDSWQGRKHRQIQPLGLVSKAGVWYMVALADNNKDARIFRLSNIVQLEVLDKQFRRPKNFDLPSFWQRACERFELSLYTGRANLRINQRGAKLLSETNAALAKAIQQTAVVDANDETWSTVEIPIENIDTAARQLLGLGANVMVLAPAELQTRVREIASQICGLYR